MKTPKVLCNTYEQLGVHVADCTTEWHAIWAAFWERAAPNYEWLLLWAPPPIVETVIPPEYHEVFRGGRLVILHRG